MEVLRTPDDRFAELEGFDVEPRYREISAADGTALRFAFVDEGPRDAPPVLLLHGNPSWSYLHRAMVDSLVERGHRAIALDLIGHGRSDKPADQAELTIESHLDWMGQWLEAEDLAGITMFCQDWGGILGLNLLADHDPRFDRVVASNTGLPSGTGETTFLKDWIAYSQSVDELPISRLVDGVTTRSLTPGELAAYDAPYPDGSYQASPKKFPVLIPVQPDNPGVPRCLATWEYLERFEKPFLTAYGDHDPIGYLAGAHVPLQTKIPGAHGQPHVVLEGPNHFIQEDAPHELVSIIDRFIADNPV